ncbi:MAG TPA: (d)CMP kinase [Marinilabiliaceae bacterium]|nr:(d)CMP kinase [Marinilabiliaceae bacterium]HBX88047.1 (d)CMP kinase [Marinilabiliaceae bacterium]
MTKITIAVDGHSSCGKSTVAKEIAASFGLIYIDTGAMYRAVTLFALQNGLIDGDLVDSEGLQASMDSINIELRKNSNGDIETFLNGQNIEKEIRQIEVSSKVSAVSSLPFVRRKMVKIQQEMGRNGGVILDGRDIGTVVFPNADLKIFMTAAPEIRAMRRFEEMQQKGEKVTYEEILENVKSRDHADSTRKESPLVKADDALLLDNSHLNREEQMSWILERLKENNWL